SKYDVSSHQVLIILLSIYLRRIGMYPEREIPDSYTCYAGKGSQYNTRRHRRSYIGFFPDTIICRRIKKSRYIVKQPSLKPAILPVTFTGKRQNSSLEKLIEYHRLLKLFVLFLRSSITE